MTMVQMRTSLWYGLAVLLVVTVSSVACSRGEAQANNPAPSGGGPAGGGRGGGQNQVVPVAVATAVQKAMPVTIQGIGTVIAASTVAVRAQITGELTSVTFKEGEDVEQGQVLVTLDKRPLEAASSRRRRNSRKTKPRRPTRGRKRRGIRICSRAGSRRASRSTR